MDFRKIEEKWQKAWQEARIFEADPKEEEKFFITIPYPYLNGNLHAGHTRTFTIGDAFARYMRMKGYNVLFPLGFHVTGTPIIGLAELISNRDERTIDVYTRFHDVPKDILLTLETPEKIVEYFSKEALTALKSIGYSIDWRRVFTTTDPEYQKFIEWQYWKLKEKGLIAKGSHPVRYCPHDANPVEDHDILMGEEATIVEFTVIKFRLENSDIIFPCATLRPETVFGVTNIWIKPTKYVLARVDDEIWFVSREAYEKLTYTDKKVEMIEEVEASEFIGKYVTVPLVNRRVPILPAEFVDTDNATGVVMSVPAHAPYDYAAIEDLKMSDDLLKKFGIDRSIVESIEPIVLIDSGDEEVPAKKIVEELGIKSQNDVDLLEKATKALYKKEFHMGVLLEITGKYAGIKVSEIKDRLQKDLIEMGVGDIFYEFSEKPVVCRCGTKCVVKVVKDQWFLNYSNPDWKAKVLDHLEYGMDIIPDYYKEEFRNKIEWLKDKACARRKGLGTRIPWDKEWLIESLSDSTIYMAYYILAKYVNSGELKAENMTTELLDYILLGLGDAETAAKSSGLDVELLEKIREEFEYWYPVDLRSSGKDLVANHLLFYIFHHIAIFPRKHWPRAIAVNGYVSLEGKKMSKSKGPLLTMKRAVMEYGADVTRLYILHAAEYDNDADWRGREVEGLASHLRRFYLMVSEHYNKDVQETTTLDRWLVSRLQKAIKETREAMDNLQTRRAVNAAFFELMNDVRWYLRRGGKNLAIILDDWLKLLAPFAPHICEELWHIKHDTFISLEKYPEYDESRIDVEAEAVESYLKSLIEDIKEVKKFAADATTVYIYPADSWKLEAIKVVAESKDVGEAIKKLMSDERLRSIAKEVTNFVKRVFRDKKEGKLIEKPLDELEIIDSNREFIEKETGLSVKTDSSAIPEDKKRAAMPGKPAIYMV
jgi:leucyl-tRNA synthetase